MPSISGSQMSRTTRSGTSSPIRASASRPVRRRRAAGTPRRPGCRRASSGCPARRRRSGCGRRPWLRRCSSGRARRRRRAPPRRPPASRDRRSAPAQHGQLDREPGPARRVVLDPDAPAMVGDDLVHDGQAEPHPRRLRREVRMEHAVAQVRGNPGPLSAIVISTCSPPRPARPDRDLGRARLHGVVDEVQHGALELVAVRVERRELRGRSRRGGGPSGASRRRAPARSPAAGGDPWASA